MSFTGHISGGHVVFDQPVPLPEGTPVRVEPIEQPVTQPPADNRPTMLDRYRHVIGKVEMPPDAAEQHDHYLYDTPKR
ncbi:MAG: hypothetical protein J2P46_01855 [Zavarzinella sp.]|nr:hypothetical protein [Zavarzinella sp.]